MSVNFVKSMQEESNWTTTENGADALKSTNNPLVDLFGTIGALRTRRNDEIVNLFIKAFAEDKLLATKMTFYARDIRKGGLGERKVPRIIWRYLANNYPEIMSKNLPYIAEFGRWDDMFELIGTPIEKEMWALIAIQWNQDIVYMNEGKPISLLAKWMKSINASSKKSVLIAKKTVKQFGITEKQYRQTLSMLRSYLDVVEKKMSRKEFDKINYNTVPSRAMMKYRNAFRNRDANRFYEYTNALLDCCTVEEQSVKINASTLYPYDIFEKMELDYSYKGNNRDTYFSFNNPDDILEAQWRALPNYVDGENNVLVMADTSGSMSGRPMCTSLGLAVYFAERNKGAFQNTFMTFSERPNFVTIKGDTLSEKIRNVESIVANTNIEKAFDMVLNVAVKNNITQDEMPKAIVIISDMSFDQGTHNGYGKPKMAYYDAMKVKFYNAGYEIPNIIYWNVNARENVFHAFSEYKGVQLASGSSPSVFLSIMKNIGMSPYEAMVNTLNNPVYDCIKV